MTPQVKVFLDEIEEISRKHGLMLSANWARGLMEVWPFEERDFEGDWAEDRT